MNTHSVTNKRSGRTEFRFSRKWWDNFTSEPIIDDAKAATEDSDDDLLLGTRHLIEHIEANGRLTKTHVIAELDTNQLTVLYEHAKWYAYYWGEEMACDGVEWVSRGRSSDLLAKKIGEIIAA